MDYSAAIAPDDDRIRPHRGGARDDSGTSSYTHRRSETPGTLSFAPLLVCVPLLAGFVARSGFREHRRPTAGVIRSVHPRSRGSGPRFGFAPAADSHSLLSACVVARS